MGWYEDWQRQNLAFNPRMDQGGGEYTGYIKDVYEGDDAQPAWVPEFFPGPSTAQQGLMGMLTPLQIAQQRKAKGDFTSVPVGAASLLAANGHQQLSDNFPNVGSLDYQRNLRKPAVTATPGGLTAAEIAGKNATPAGWMQTAGSIGAHAVDAFTPGTDSHKGYMDSFSKLADWIPEDVRNSAFSQYDRIMNAVKEDWDKGKGGLNPMSRNNYIQQLVDAGASNEVIAQLMDKYGPTVEALGGSALNAGRSMWNRAQQGISDIVGPIVDNATNINEITAAALTPTTIQQSVTPTSMPGDQFEEYIGTAPTETVVPGVPSMFSSPGEAEVAGAVPTAIFPAGASEAPFETPSESQTLRQAIKPYFDVDAGLSVGGGALAGLGTAKYVPKAVAGTYAAWKNMPSQQLKSLQSELDGINKTMADTEFLGPEQQKLKKRAAAVEGEMDKINSRVTGRQKAMNFAKGKMDAMKVTGGKLKRGATSAAKKGLVGLAYGAGATAVGAGVSLLISNMAFAAVPDAIESGHLPPDAEDWSEDDKVAAIYALSKTGEIPPDFANRFDMSQDAGGMISTVAGAIPDPISAVMAIADNEKNIRAHRTGTAFTGPEMWRQPLTRGANYPRGLF